MRARKVVEHEYTEAEWTEIKRALARVGVDADTARVKISGHDDPLGTALSLAAALPFDHLEIMEASAEAAKNIARVLRQIKKTERCIDEIAARMPRLETGSYYAPLRDASAALNERYGKRPHRVTKQDKIDSRLHYFEFLRQIYASITGKDGKKPTPLGASDGPFVDFLYTASGPVLGREFLTKPAIHAFLKRNWKDGQTLLERLVKRGVINNRFLPSSQT
jgi:hypothetical protein